VVVDGERVAAPGLAINGIVTFSDDESRYAYAVVSVLAIAGPGKDPIPAQGVVVDGRYQPIERASGVRFVGNHPVANIYDPQKGGRMIVLEVSTPQVAPTSDEFQATSRYSKPVRVVIGESVGPGFDQIEKGSLKIAGGQVSYTGVRAGRKLKVVDNVIMRPMPPPQVEQEPPPPDEQQPLEMLPKDLQVPREQQQRQQ